MSASHIVAGGLLAALCLTVFSDAALGQIGALRDAAAAAEAAAAQAESERAEIARQLETARMPLTGIRALADAARETAALAERQADAAKAAAAAAGDSDEAVRLLEAAERAAQNAKAAADRADLLADNAEEAERLLNADTNLLEIYPYIGQAIDNFAASEIDQYLNPDASGEIKTRETAGIVFQYPLFESRNERRSFWVYGQTMHGVRSADIDCAANPELAQCVDFADAIAEHVAAGDRALYILRRSSSLEAMLGFRYEFFDLNGGDAALYVSAQTGFVTVDDDDDDAADVDHFAIGARVKHGRYRNSYLEIGKGTNDMFELNPDGRFKINARIVVRPRLLGDWGLFFAHLVADVDGSSGADSVQTFLGIAFCPWGEGGCPRN